MKRSMWSGAVAVVMLVCGLGSIGCKKPAAAAPAGPPPQFFPRLTDAVWPDSVPRLSTLADQTILEVRSEWERLYGAGTAPMPTEQGTVTIHGISFGPRLVVRKDIGPSYVQHTFSRLPLRGNEPRVTDITVHYGVPSPERCAPLREWATRAATYPCSDEYAHGPSENGSFIVCGGDPTGQLPIKVVCETYGAGTDISVHVLTDQLPLVLPYPLPAAPANFRDPPPPPRAATPPPTNPAAAPTPSAPAAPAARADGRATSFPVEDGIAFYTDYYACTSGQHTMNNLALTSAGSSGVLRASGSCELIITNSLLEGTSLSSVITTDDRAQLTLVDTTVTGSDANEALGIWGHSKLTVVHSTITARSRGITTLGHPTIVLDRATIRAQVAIEPMDRGVPISAAGTVIEGGISQTYGAPRLTDLGGNTGFVLNPR